MLNQKFQDIPGQFNGIIGWIISFEVISIYNATNTRCEVLSTESCIEKNSKFAKKLTAIFDKAKFVTKHRKYLFKILSNSRRLAFLH